MELQNIRFAGQRLIESYGDKGFRLSDGRLEGSILVLPSGAETFLASEPSDIAIELFNPVFDQKKDIEILLLGTGAEQHFPPAKFRKTFIENNISLEIMDTGAACRTFNVLVSEERRVAAALIAV